MKAAADAGDDTARGLLAEAGRWLGIMPYVRRGLRIVPAALGNDAAMIGAVRGLPH